MTLYIRAYSDFSYELIFLEGRFKKRRLHLLINPSKRIGLPGMKDKIELNIESLTHIIAMQTSVSKHDLIERTTFIAERTNKPIITNSETSEKFRERGLSVRQLRVLGFQEEVVEGIKIDPVYMQELSDEIKPPEKDSILKKPLDLVKKANPLTWKPIKKLTSTLLPIDSKGEKQDEVDPSKPLAFHIFLGGNTDILLPLDKRGISHLEQIIPQLEPTRIVLPEMDVSFTLNIKSKLSEVIILNSQITDDNLLILPKTHNTSLKHDTLYGALEEWVEIE